jgi:uncharacterized protein with WD repeat
VVGFDQANAERMVQGVGLVPVRSAEFSDDVPEGQVIAQEPAGDTRLDPCAGEVSIVVSLGAGEVATGETPAGAEDTPETTMPVSTASGRAPITPDNAASVINIATLGGHTDNVCTVAFSPDGTLLASGSWDETVKLWNIAAGTEATTLDEHTAVVWGLAFSPDGAVLASGSGDGRMKLWNVATGTESAMLKGLQGLRGVAFSPDGQLLASGSRDDMVRLWSVITSAEPTILEGHTENVYDVAFSPDGAFLASASEDSTVRLWEVSTGETITLKGHTDNVWSVAFSPNGKLLASGSWDGTVRLWDVATGRQTALLSTNADNVWEVAFSPDGRLLASASSDGTVKLWNVDTGAEAATLQSHAAEVMGVAFSPDGTLLASSSDDTVKLWAVSTGVDLAAIERIRERTREAIAGKWIMVRGPEGVIEREPDMPDYDFVFYADGSLETFNVQTTFASVDADGNRIETPGGTGTEYIPVNGTYEVSGATELRIQQTDTGFDDMTVQFSISGDRMTWLMDGIELELERIGPVD